MSSQEKLQMLELSLRVSALPCMDEWYQFRTYWVYSSGLTTGLSQGGLYDHFVCLLEWSMHLAYSFGVRCRVSKII